MEPPQPVPPLVQKLKPKTLIMSYGATVGRLGADGCAYEDALVTDWITGRAPIASVTVPVGDVHAAPIGLHTPSVTVPPDPPGENGNSGSDAGTVRVTMMFEALTTVAERLASATSDPAATMPTVVRCAAS